MIQSHYPVNKKKDVGMQTLMLVCVCVCVGGNIPWFFTLESKKKIGKKPGQ